jgi:hypothetical protein
MASYTVVNKSDAAIYWHERFERFMETTQNWYSDDLPPGESRTVPSGTPSARRGSGPVIQGVSPYVSPVIPGTQYRDRPDENANVTIYAKQGDRYVNWGNVWIHLGKTLEVYGGNDWWLK